MVGRCWLLAGSFYLSTLTTNHWQLTTVDCVTFSLAKLCSPWNTGQLQGGAALPDTELDCWQWSSPDQRRSSKYCDKAVSDVWPQHRVDLPETVDRQCWMPTVNWHPQQDEHFLSIQDEERHSSIKIGGASTLLYSLKYSTVTRTVGQGA